MRLRVLSVIFLLIFANSGEVYGQYSDVGTPPISNFTRTTFNAGTQNWSISQTSQGSILFGNNKGLLSYNGNEWTLSPLPNLTIVRSVTIATDGRIYVGGQNELGYFEYDVQNQLAYQSMVSQTPEEFRDFADVWQNYSIGETQYFCTDKGVFKFENNGCEVIAPQQNKFENFFRVQDAILVQEKGLGVSEVTATGLNQIISAETYADQRIVSILPRHREQRLLFTIANGIYLNEGNQTNYWQCPASEFLKLHQAYCAIKLDDGNYAIGTIQNGLILMNSSGEILNHIGKEKGLMNNTVLSIFQDKAQNLWLGLDNGISYVEISSPFKFIGSVEGIEGTGYTAIAKDGKLFLGTNQGLYAKDWPTAEISFDTPFVQVPGSKGQIWSLNEVGEQLIINQHKGTALLGDSALVTLSGNEGAWTFLPLESRPGYALQGTYNGFMIYKQVRIDSLVSWQEIGKLDGFNESSRIFQEDRNGDIWVSHAYRGLYRITLAKDSLEIDEVKPFGAESGLPSDLYITASEIRGEIVYASQSGIYDFNPDTQMFVSQPDLSELLGTNSNVHRIFEDELGNIWYSIANQFGLIKIKEQGVYNEVEILRFDELQDDLVDGFEQVYAYDSENIFIAAENGFIHYNSATTHPSDFLFDLNISQYREWEKEDSLHTNTSEIDNSIKTLRFAFNTPVYSQLNNVKYRVKLEGLDSDWSEWSERNDKEYTNLEAGDYTFLVQAKNAYGKESAESAMRFKVLPPWYSTNLAKVGYVVIFVLGVFVLFKVISKREKNKTKVFKQEQIKKLEQKEAEFKEEVSRTESELIKVRNDKLRSDIKHKNSELASTTMHLVQKSEILVKIKKDLGELGKNAPTELRREIKQIERRIEADVRLDKNWEQFEKYFDQVHQNFFKQLRANFPDLTPKDQKLCAYLRMNLSTKEIAPLLTISVRGVEISRYRLRKKMGLDSNTNLVSYIMEI